MSKQGSPETRAALIGCAGAIIAALIGLTSPVVQRMVTQLDATPLPSATTIVVDASQNASSAQLVPTIAPSPFAGPSVSPPESSLSAPVLNPTSAAPPALPQPISDAPQSQVITPQYRQMINNYLTAANQTEIYTVSTGDLTYAPNIFAGRQLQALNAYVTDLNSRGLSKVPQWDNLRSYIRDIRIVNDNRIDVDTCEIWSATYYRRLDFRVDSFEQPTLRPQTITIEREGTNWYITWIQFYDPPYFCQ